MSTDGVDDVSLNPAYTDIYHKTGHYLNIINPGYNYMGAAFAPSTDYTVWNAYEQSFGFYAKGQFYTVDDDEASTSYEKALDEYNKADGKLSDRQQDVDDCMSDLESANADKNAAAEAYTDAVTLAGQAYSKSKQMKREYEEHVEQQKGDEETAAEIERLRQLMEAAEKDWKTAQSKTDNLHKVYIAKDQAYLTMPKSPR